MNINRHLSASLLAIVTAAGAQAATPAQAPETSIPFANNGGIRNWHADRDKGLWIQDSRGRWYYARFMGGTCRGLTFATSIGFETLPTGSLDRSSTVVVPREGRCPLQSLVSSEGPPKRKKAGDEADAEHSSQSDPG